MKNTNSNRENKEKEEELHTVRLPSNKNESLFVSHEYPTPLASYNDKEDEKMTIKRIDCKVDENVEQEVSDSYHRGI